jgi:small-conductance mechanosensitive channel
LNSEVYKRFLKEGIEIPYPKRDVYVREMRS